MNSLKTAQRNAAEKEHEAWLKQRKEEDERLAKMTAEERQEYYKKKSETHKRIAQLLGLGATINANLSAGTPYSIEK